MDDGGTVHIVTLDQKPCVVHYLEQYNKFIVATYELYSSIEEARSKLVTQQSINHNDDAQLKKSLEKINYRAGKFILLRGNDGGSVPNIEYDFHCYEGGGIFDAKIKFNPQDGSYHIYAAHANGSIGIYKLSLHCGNKICLKEHIKVPGSKMLTSIDIFPNADSNGTGNGSCNNQSKTNTTTTTTTATTRLGSPMLATRTSKVVVGDSDGNISVYYQGDYIKENVTHTGDSIWQVKSLKLASKREIVLVGADNCSWYIYAIDELEKKLILLYRNSFKDFTAGITSISIVDIVHSNEYDLIEVLLGSYDETLQTYHVKLNHHGISKPGVCHKNTISIKGGGIWRVKPLRGSKRQLCIAAMYAGSYVLSMDGSANNNNNNNSTPVDANQQPQQLFESEETLINLIDTRTLKLSQKPLHYDIDVSSCNTTYCIVDFNNSLCLFKTIEKPD